MTAPSVISTTAPSVLLHDHLRFKPKGILPVLAQNGKRPPGWAVATLGWLEAPQKLGDMHVCWWVHEHSFPLAGKQHKEEKLT